MMIVSNPPVWIIEDNAYSVIRCNCSSDGTHWHSDMTVLRAWELTGGIDSSPRVFNHYLLP